jgi:MerR family transcriptional regulator, light-induced transcriptional regulator
VRVAAEDEPRPSRPARASLLDAPAAAHPQVAAEDEAALETKEEVLPDGLDRLERPAVELLDEPLAGGARVRRLDLDPLAGEHLQSPRRAMETVALRHIVSVDGQSGRALAAGLNIAALAQRTGVAPDTLRKWEQRYRILQPTRTAGGQRRYSERDVARVEWLRARLEEGYRIGEAASLLGTAGVEPARLPREHLKCLVDALDDADTAQIGVRLDQAFALLGVDATLDAVVRPLLETVGERWADDRLSVAEEHLVSEAVRSRLAHLLADAGGGVRGVAVLTCAPGEQHELGLMMTAIALRRDGWKIAYLGADTPLSDAAALAERLGARILGISVATSERAAVLERALRDMHPSTALEVLVGGAAATKSLAKRVGATHAGPALAASVETARRIAA